MATLVPQRLKPRYWTRMEIQVRRMLYEIIFAPIAGIINDAGKDDLKLSLRNAPATSPLVKAIRMGRVQYVNGAFTGTFSAAITSELRRMGAEYDAKRKAFLLGSFQVPSDVKAEAAAYQAKARMVHKEIRAQIDDILKTLDAKVDAGKLDARETVDDVESGFKAAAKTLEVNPELSDRSKDRLARDYTENMKLYIKKFSGEQVLRLRDAVEENAREGYRFDALIDTVKRRYNVTTRHAKFLARNETSIFMAKYHQERYGEAGVTHYIWSTSHDARVRPALGTKDYGDNHRRLDGRTFAFAKPPIVDTATGRRCNPGEDYNCRCVAIPILVSSSEARQKERESYQALVESTEYAGVRP